MEINIAKDPNFKRAMMLLEDRIDTPEYLFSLWRILPKVLMSVPPPEEYPPWYSGLEKYITL